ncbi:unnamed protein product [Bursaphelenchus xylophilus]|nr:unnamed protein product [Bursaphelenchus xylophilus]CAG9085225.1 unnamed protein product [Bursaphelenchus xylophilus]
MVLKGREKEYKLISDLISTSFEERHPQSIMVRGVPGSGKTATIRLVVNDLKEKLNFVPAYINCASITTKSDFFRRIYYVITKNDTVLTASEAAKKTEKVLFSQRTVLVLDEIDFLTKLDSSRTSLANSIIKKIFDWPLNSGGKVVVVGISNELDFSEKVLPKKRVMLPDVVLFNAYSVEQLIDILMEYVRKDENLATAEAVKLCARKISAMNGDVRRAFSLLSSQTEFIEEEMEEEPALKRPKTVGLSTPCKSRPSTSTQSSPTRTPKTHKDILLSLQNIYSSPAVSAKIPLHPRIVLASIIKLMESENSSKKVQTVSFAKLHELYDKVCKKMRIEPLNHEALRDAVSTLVNTSILSLKKDKICMEVDVDCARKKIQDDELINSVGSIGN